MPRIARMEITEEEPKKKEIWYWVVLIIFLILTIVLLITSLVKPKAQVDEIIAKCIGQNSILYSQLGCSHCIDQEKLFGETYKYLTVVDCWYEPQLCVESNITGTPSWVINGEIYNGVHKVDELMELTGC